MDAKKPLAIEELRAQLAAETIQAIVCKPIMHGGDLTDCRLVMEAVLVGVCETLERIGGSAVPAFFDFDEIVINARAAARQRRLVREAAE